VNPKMLRDIHGAACWAVYIGLSREAFSVLALEVWDHAAWLWSLPEEQVQELLDRQEEGEKVNGE